MALTRPCQVLKGLDLTSSGTTCSSENAASWVTRVIRGRDRGMARGWPGPGDSAVGPPPSPGLTPGTGRREVLFSVGPANWADVRLDKQGDGSRTNRQKSKTGFPQRRSPFIVITSTFVDVCPAPAPASAAGRAVTEQTASALMEISVSF